MKKIQKLSEQLPMTKRHFPDIGNLMNIFGKTPDYWKYAPHIIGYVYLIKNEINEKVYIGVTKNIYSRRRKHLFDLKKHIHHNAEMQKDFILDKEKNFSFGIIEFIYQSPYADNPEYVLDIDIGNKLLSKENYWINYFHSKSPNGYNNPDHEIRLQIDNFNNSINQLEKELESAR